MIQALALFLASIFIVHVRSQNAEAYMSDNRVVIADANGQPISWSNLNATSAATQDTSANPAFHATECSGWVSLYAANTSISFTFSGTTIVTNYLWNAEGGTANVIIDGVTTQFQNWASDISGSCYVMADRHDGLAEGTHTIQVVGTSTGFIDVHSFLFDAAPLSAKVTTLSTIASAAPVVTTTTSASAPALFTQQSSLGASPATPSPTSTESSSLDSSKHPNIVIVGGVIAGVCVLVIVSVVGFLVYRRRSHRSQLSSPRRHGSGVLDDEREQYGIPEASVGWYYLGELSKRPSAFVTEGAAPIRVMPRTHRRQSVSSSSAPTSPAGAERIVNPFTLPAATRSSREDISDRKTPPQTHVRPSSAGSSPETLFISANDESGIPSASGSRVIGNRGPSLLHESVGTSRQPKLPQVDVIRKLLERGCSNSEVASALRVMYSKVENGGSHGAFNEVELNEDSNPPPPRYTYRGKSRA